MANINNCTFSGNLTRDPEIRHVGSDGTAVTKFTLAVNGFKDGDTMYLDCDAWGKTGEVANQYLKKGVKATVTGRLQIRKYDTKEGEKRTAVSLRVNDLELPPKPQGSSSGGSQRGSSVGGGGYDDEAFEDDIPFFCDPREFERAYPTGA